MSDLTVSYVDLGTAARAWDDEHLDLAAASVQVGGALVTGFTDEVTRGADEFRDAWSGHVADLALAAEHRADGLRDSLREALAADAASAHFSWLLRGYLEEQR